MKKTQLMLILPALFLCADLASAQALASPAAPPAQANSCGEPAGTYSEPAKEGAVTRVVRRFKAPDGHYVYSYALEISGVGPYNPVPPQSNSFDVHVTLNGKSADTEGFLYCTSSSINTIIDNRCVEPGTNLYGLTASQDLFFYAAYGDQLNAWDVTLRVLNPSTHHWEETMRMRLDQKRLSELRWE